MVIQAAIAKGATQINRRRQILAELRIEEQIKVQGIADEYDRVDRVHDNEIKRAFSLAYHSVDSEPEKEAIAQAFATWIKQDARKDGRVHEDVDSAVTLLKAQTPEFVNGAWVPTGSGDVA